ncbi:MAG: aminomethyl-transferring glycine dehydrogenase, partial [Candidatus Bathyarchaeia archaeon]
MDKHNHPYIPNSQQKIKQEMMREIGIKSIDELYADIPEKYKLKKPLNIPQSAISEFEVKRRVEALLSKNKTCNEMPMFLGAGCWPHYVPAVVKEI